MKKILVPCDLSKTSVEAFKFAIEVAKAVGGKITILHVTDLPVVYDTTFGGQPYLYDPSMYQAIAEYAKKRFRKLVQKYGKSSIQVKYAAIQGLVTPVIRQFIKRHKPDGVVMGTHGASGIKEFLVGSNTEKIVRSSGVPVFAIRKNVKLAMLRNIVVPITLDSNQGDFIRRLKELQRLLKAKLHLLHIISPGEFGDEKDLLAFAKKHQLKDYTLNLRSNRHEQDGIMNFVFETKADMIAMATHARKGLAHWVSGSITEDVVNHVKCPIWTCALKKS